MMHRECLLDFAACNAFSLLACESGARAGAGAGGEHGDARRLGDDRGGAGASCWDRAEEHAGALVQVVMPCTYRRACGSACVV